MSPTGGTGACAAELDERPLDELNGELAADDRRHLGYAAPGPAWRRAHLQEALERGRQLVTEITGPATRRRLPSRGAR